MISRGQSFDRASGGAHFRTFPSRTQNRNKCPNCSCFEPNYAPSPKGGPRKGTTLYFPNKSITSFLKWEPLSKIHHHGFRLGYGRAHHAQVLTVNRYRLIHVQCKGSISSVRGASNPNFVPLFGPKPF
ncbi:hypothetical protein CsSME_00001489 [Camellia sinensis var. sinensis]